MKKGGAGGRKGGSGSRRLGKGGSTGAAPYVALAVVVTVGALILLSQQILPMVAQAGTGPTPATVASAPAAKRTPTSAAGPAAAKAATPTAVPRSTGRTQPSPTPRPAPMAPPAPAATVAVAGRTPTDTARAGAPTPTAGAAASPTATSAAPAARATAAVPAPHVPAAPGEISRVPTSRKLLALTFDAGSDLGATLETLAVLRAGNVHSTFFVTGTFAEKWPAVVKQIASDGHELGNHSYSHPDFTKLSDQEIRQELAEAEDAIDRAAGRVAVALVRTPFGSRDARVLRVIGEAGYRAVYWALDSADWRPEATPEGVSSRVLKGVDAGDVVVQHCSTVASARGLPAILEGLNQRGLVPVTVGFLLSENR